MDIRLLVNPWRRGPELCSSPRSRHRLLNSPQITYSWSGRKSWSELTFTSFKRPVIHTGHFPVFALFVAVWNLKMPRIAACLTMPQNRYAPLVHLIWLHVIMFHYNESVSSCPQRTRSIMLTKPPPVVRLSPHRWSPPIQQPDSCEDTKWIPVFHGTISTVFAQTAIALRSGSSSGWNSLES